MAALAITLYPALRQKEVVVGLVVVLPLLRIFISVFL